MRIAKHPQIRFVHQRGRLQSMIRALLVEMLARDAVKLRLYQRHQLVGSGSVAGARAVE